VREDLLLHVAGSLVTLDAVEEYVRPDNLARLVREGYVALLAAASLLLNTLLLALGERPPYAEACFDTHAALMRPVL
jgi:hypothetical protein